MGEAATLSEAVPEEAVTEPEGTGPVAADPLPLAYKTFSPKLAPAMTALGGATAVAGGLGAWVRAVRVQTEGLAPEEVAVTYGYNDPEGMTIAVSAALALLTAAFWIRRRPILKVIPSLVIKLVPALASFAVVGLVAWQVPLIDRDARALADQAISDASFVSFHAGLGWGAWCLVAGGVLLFLGTIVGILREIDLRRGKAA